MNILATQYTLQTYTFEIYLAGCKGKNGVHCKGCHNPESWNFDQGEIYDGQTFLKMVDKIQEFRSLVKNIAIFGGEPLDQEHEELENMLKDLHQLGLPIWIFTRFSFDAVPDFVKEYCTYIKCGEYDATKIVDDNIQYKIKLATSNQHIYKKGEDY